MVAKSVKLEPNLKVYAFPYITFFSDFQSCGMKFPFGCLWILFYLVLGGIGAFGGYYIGDNYFNYAGNSTNITDSVY